MKIIKVKIFIMSKLLSMEHKKIQGIIQVKKRRVV